MVQEIFRHLQPEKVMVQGLRKQGAPIDLEAIEDNGERVIAGHLRVFLGAILGFHLEPTD